MKKLLLSSLILGMFSFNARADWNYCYTTSAVTTDSWAYVIHKTWSGGPYSIEVQTQYRVYTYNPFTGTTSPGNWQDLPSSGYIGNMMGGSIEIREIDMWMPSGPVIRRQFFISHC
jgi:hypothetical protein